MIFILGVLCGLLNALIVFALVRRFEPTITRTFHQADSTLRKKGSIIEPEDESLQEWVDSLKKDETV